MHLSGMIDSNPVSDGNHLSDKSPLHMKLLVGMMSSTSNNLPNKAGGGESDDSVGKHVDISLIIVVDFVCFWQFLMVFFSPEVV